MKLNKTFVLLIIVAFLPISSALAFTNTITLEQEQIQQRVNKAFPVNFGNQELSIEFYHPKLKLSNDKNQILLTTHAKIVSYDELLEHSTISFGGKPYYYSQNGEFRLRDLWLQAFKAKGLDPAQELQITLLVNLALSSVLVDIPIYTLNDENLRERIAKKRLRSAKVVDGKLELEFSLD